MLDVSAYRMKNLFEQLDVRRKKPTKAELQKLQTRGKAAFKKLKSEESAAKLPIFIEFSGSPKSGKSTIIGIIGHFLKRIGLEVSQPSEGASLRTPKPLKDDWLAFNAWSGCYALQNILEHCFADPPAHIVLLDRGLFDLVAWMDFMQRHEGRISEEDCSRIVDFFTLDFWRSRENAVFLFTADHETSLLRENECKLTTDSGSMMEATKLAGLLDSYETVAARVGASFSRVLRVDTSAAKRELPDFQRIAFSVAEKIVDIIEELGTQYLLVIDEIGFTGFTMDPSLVSATARRIVNDGDPRFLERSEAEKSSEVQQVVPYALLKKGDGRYFTARRRADAKRDELKRKKTLLVGGHAERRDLDPSEPDQIFERCLRRELEEELVAINILSIQPKGMVYDPSSKVGRLHLAYIFEVEIGGNVAIRRQAIDKEFGRESISWVDEAGIRELAADLDPWSQLVAHALFGAEIPATDRDLFS